jgi:hypothetical protein
VLTGDRTMPWGPPTPLAASFVEGEDGWDMVIRRRANDDGPVPVGFHLDSGSVEPEMLAPPGVRTVDAYYDDGNGVRHERIDVVDRIFRRPGDYTDVYCQAVVLVLDGQTWLDVRGTQVAEDLPPVQVLTSGEAETDDLVRALTSPSACRPDEESPLGSAASTGLPEEGRISTFGAAALGLPGAPPGQLFTIDWGAKELAVWLPDGDEPAVWATASGFPRVARLNVPGTGPMMATLTTADAVVDDPDRLLARVEVETVLAWLVFDGTGPATTVHVPANDNRGGYAIAIPPAD